MALFETAFKLTLGHEGGYSNDLADSGGETIYGIARNKNPQWIGWALVDNMKKDAKNFPKNALADSSIQSHVKGFYKTSFWDKLLLDKVNSQEIANELFDTSVNMGVGRATNFFIWALNLLNRTGIDYPDLPEDGSISDTDIQAMNANKRPYNVLKTLNGLQFMHYYNITKANPTQEKFFNGWLNRV